MNQDNQTPPKENKNPSEQPAQIDPTERKMYIQKTYKEILTEKWQDFKKFARTHMPHFVHAWHAKVDVHVFRYTLGGLGIFLILVLLIAMMAGMNQGTERTTGTKASETDSISISVVTKEQILAENDRKGKDNTESQEAYLENEWLVRIETQGRVDDVYGIYVSFCNDFDKTRFRFTQTNKYITTLMTTDLVELRGDKNIVARVLADGDKPVTMFNPLGASYTLFGAEPSFEKPRIREAYLYILPEWEGDRLDIKEIPLEIKGGSCAGGESDSDERDVSDDEEEPEPDREDESDEDQSGEPKCGLGFDRSYWAEDDPNDQKCVCVNEEEQDYKELRSKEVAGREVSDRKYCDNDAAVGEERTSPRDPDSIDQSLPPEPEGEECQGGEAYIDDFSFKDDDGNVIEKCICNLDYKEVDMRLCRAQEIDPTLPPQPEESQPDGKVRCYTNEYCGSIGAGSCDGGSCSSAIYGTCSGPSNEPDETAPNQWCGDRFGSKGDGDRREDKPSDGGGDDGGGRSVEIQKESCNGEAYWDTTSFSSKACVCTDDYLTVPNSYCE